MIRRHAKLVSLLLAVTLSLTGCMGLGGVRSETIVIPDTEEQAQAGGNAPFDVKTIYRVMSQGTEAGVPLGWLDQDALLSLMGDSSGASSLERVDYPYESHLKWRVAETKPDYMALSPNGQSLALVVPQADGSFALKLVSTTNQQETALGQIGMYQIRSVKMGWSNNGRYFFYLSRNAVPGGDEIHVYDTATKSAKHYTAPDWKPTDTIASIHLSDDAESVAVVKISNRTSYVQFGGWSGSELSTSYEHFAARDSRVEWIHDDQIAFLGPEGTLYAYDRRNAALSILLEQTGMFRLSPDRKSVVYTQDKDTLYVASLYGNNVLNKTQIFRGLVPTLMEWSPDGGKLLLGGWKLYEQENPRPSQPAPIGMQNMVIEFK